MDGKTPIYPSLPSFREPRTGGGGLAADERQGEDGDLEESEAGGEEGPLSVFRVLHQGE